ncbi:unnamed protein product, partial [Mesorhabditis belari]|uniref:Uncharacterized protein n=1 Tax=Mesorhabditis belari TaxID=2138241 RepID=A0AAF3F2E8_9BILA
MRIFLALCFFGFSYAYMFDCLDKCECDTEDEVIHCHNGQRTKLTLPTGTRLRGFPVIGLTFNNIQKLPDQDTLLEKFPDLKIVDVERNPNFDCSSLENYNRIKIITDCEKNITDIQRVPRIDRPTRECDLACQAEKHYKKLHEYALQLWEVIKQKYENFDVDESLKQIREFFKKVVAKVQGFGQNVQQKWNQTGQADHPKAIGAKTSLGDDVHLPTQGTIDV